MSGGLLTFKAGCIGVYLLSDGPNDSAASLLQDTGKKLDKLDLLILDDLAYVTKDQAEPSVLFELISARYERRSI